MMADHRVETLKMGAAVRLLVSGRQVGLGEKPFFLPRPTCCFTACAYFTTTAGGGM
jgi:hypothetical protein